MPYFLRKIRKSRWYKSETVHWLEGGDIQADPLGDLSTQNNELSLWLVEDDKSNLDRIVSALAASRDFPSNFDYVLFDQKIPSGINIKIQKSIGGTPDEKINNDCHWDLAEVSANKLVELARKIVTDELVTERVIEKKVLKLIEKAVEGKRINVEKLRPNLREKVEAGRYKDMGVG